MISQEYQLLQQKILDATINNRQILRIKDEELRIEMNNIP